MKSLQRIISGTVQGVGLRYSIRRKADELGVRGWVKNNSDGTVSAVVQGEDSAVERFLDWLKTGEFSKFISKIDAKEQSLDSSLTSFEIRF